MMTEAGIIAVAMTFIIVSGDRPVRRVDPARPPLFSAWAGRT